MELNKIIIFLFFLINFFNILDLITTFIGISRMGFSFESNQIVVSMIKRFGWIIFSIIKIVGTILLSYVLLQVIYIENNLYYFGKIIVLIGFIHISILFIYVLIGNFGVLFGIS